MLPHAFKAHHSNLGTTADSAVVPKALTMILAKCLILLYVSSVTQSSRNPSVSEVTKVVFTSLWKTIFPRSHTNLDFFLNLFFTILAPSKTAAADSADRLLQTKWRQPTLHRPRKYYNRLRWK